LGAKEPAGWAATLGARYDGPRRGKDVTGTRAMADETFRDRVLGRLSGLGGITSRPLFGGHGLYWRGTIFGIVFEDRLYLKVDDRSKSEFESRGMGPFRPNERQTLKSYYEVPPEVLGDPEALVSWAREAIRAARSSTCPG
jgi:DNA transformation protein